ncbi:MAG: bifunctional 5,10-methylenetetrahydrofolate dehydrogenase/5,10-methenyltetrahydrofolate cyclohydrolase [Candidatus Omnitrophica bacterium]|nr:bifunctional 5,10-methylenetetrahydrofolate dehydrogenase/5,10-methenyltetrahydrofolate cyclohydrolase [Candidatus Omnitrophota bacterium]
MAKVIDGKKIALEMQVAVKEELEALRPLSGSGPKLVSVMAGREKDAILYVRVQKKTADSMGIAFDICELDETIGQEGLIKKIEGLNRDDTVTAIIVQHPLPAGIDHDRVISAIRPEKDAEGIHPCNLGRIFRREADIIPCTSGAVMKILKAEGVDLYGRDVVIIGHSAVVGKPLSLMMLNKTATTTVCHIGTAEKGDITGYTQKADILVVAVGKAGMVKGDWIKEGAVVIDVGINNTDGGVVGDVDFDGALKKASMVTPVPGGVGPVTVSILMRNVSRLYGMSREEKI